MIQLLLFLCFLTSVTSLLLLKNFSTDVTINSKNISFILIIENYTMELKTYGYEIELYFNIPKYDFILSRYYPIIPFGKQLEPKPIFDKLQLSFITNKVFVIPKVNYLYNGYYHLKALFTEQGIYNMLIRLECGLNSYMTMQRQCRLKLSSHESHQPCYLESRSIVNNFFVNISKTVINDREDSKNCTSSQAFDGRIFVNNIDYYDNQQYNGNIKSTFKPYGCKLSDDVVNSTQILNSLSNQHVIFLGDSTLEAVYRGILERIYGTNAFQIENNSLEWIKYSSLFVSNKLLYARVSKRFFDLNKSNLRLSFLFNGASSISSDQKGAIVENFTQSKHWEFYLSELRRIIKESISQCRPITLLFNSGLHDIASLKNLVADNLYERNLETSLIHLKLIISEEKAKRINILTCPDSAIKSYYFWLNTVPTFSSSICYGGYVRYLNKIATSIVRRYDFQVLDGYSLITGIPQNSKDGLHCLGGYWKGNYTSNSCQVLVDSYLHAIIHK